MKIRKSAIESLMEEITKKKTKNQNKKKKKTHIRKKEFEQMKKTMIRPKWKKTLEKNDEKS